MVVRLTALFLTLNLEIIAVKIVVLALTKKDLSRT